MNFRIFFFAAMLVFSASACKSLKKTTKSDSPYLTEQNSTTGVTVREEKVKVVDQADGTLYRFYVIIGSFREIDNARKEKTNLVKEGFLPVILENENGLFRISAGAFNDEKAARDRIAQIRAKYKNHEDVWLLVRK